MCLSFLILFFAFIPLPSEGIRFTVEGATSAKKSFAPSVTRLRPDLDRRKFYALGTYSTL